MRCTLAVVLTMTGLLAIACGGSAPTSPSRAAVASPSAAIAVAQSTAPALFGAGAVDFARCLQAAGDSGCFAGAARMQPRAVGATATAPGAPINLSTSSSGSSVALTWGAPLSGDAVTTYLIEAGSGSGLANLANVVTNNTATSFATSGVSNGTYYVRVRAQNASGTSGASNESILVVGSAACTSAPNAPSGLTIVTSGSTVTLTWSAPAGGCPSTSYLLQAGSSTGTSDLANSVVGAGTSYVATGVGAGTYYVRVRASNAYGTSAGSNEAVATVTAGTPTPVPGGVGGTWIGLAPDGMTTQNPQCPRDVDDLQFVLTQTGSNITGTVIGRIRESFYPPDVGKSQTGSVTGSVNGNAFSFAIDFVVPIGQGPSRGQGTATFTSTRMTGTINSVPPDPCNAGAFAVNRQ